MDRIPVAVHAEDPLSHAGVAGQLRSRPEILIVEPGSRTQPRVAVVVADSADEPTMHRLCALQRSSCRTVLVVTSVDDAGLAAAVEAGMSGLVRRSGATADRLAAAICAADGGEATVPPDLLGRLLDQVDSDVTSRLGLRNRSHAVAYAVRQGLI